MSSTWLRTWREDFERVLCSMSGRERIALDHWGLLCPQGRRVFVVAADRLMLDVAYEAFIMQQAAFVGA